MHALLAISACNVMGQISVPNRTDDDEVWSDLLGMDGHECDLDNFGSILALYEGVLDDMESKGSVEEHSVLKIHRDTLLQHL